ncbi:hypothetical protein MKK68_01960 [Methylobacterium sp. E-016]|uniref:hypothetical protein n=1 Tax=Methylobacterium sp. E-016 TaxID=2836556 RepID=UPI001FBB9217|nr:hypothetical protein [Methylobacterium sp. E-016]MCJ2074427.1 hypothetical protein [Methylobacterium sp. E-016]
MSTLVTFLLILLAYRLRKWILVLLILVLVAGCEHAPVVPPRVTLDARTYTTEQLTCLPDPPIPGRPRTAAAVGRYIADLHEAGANCRGALGAIHDREAGAKP